MELTEQKNKNRYIHTLFHGDPVIWIVFFLLCAISVIEVYSATSTLSYKDGHYWTPVVKHSMYLLVGFVIAFLVHNIPCRWFKLYPLLFMPASWLLLIMVPFVGLSSIRKPTIVQQAERRQLKRVFHSFLLRFFIYRSFSVS